MINEELKIFVKSALAKGEPKEKISADLLANGWNQNDINEVFDLVQGGTGVPVYDIPKYSKKDLVGLNKYLVFISIALLMGGGGFAVYKTGYWRNFLPVEDIKIAENPLTTAQSAEDPYKDWQTYANAEYGFEIQIPQSWVVNKGVQEGVDFASPETLRLYQESLNCECDGAPSYDVHFYNLLGEKDKDLGTENISGIVWSKYLQYGLLSDINYEVSKDGKVYRFSASDINADEKEEVLSQILSTFKFTE